MDPVSFEARRREEQQHTRHTFCCQLPVRNIVIIYSIERALFSLRNEKINTS